MKSKIIARIFLATLCIFLHFNKDASAANIRRPELIDYNLAGATICSNSLLKIKFEHELFNPGNIFTVEIALNGNFGGGGLITMEGQLSQSGNLQTAFLTVAFPASVLSGTNYRLRVKGSSPLTYSNQLNEFPFAVSKLVNSDPTYYPEGYWRGYFYSWIPSISSTILDATNEDTFNPDRYSGYISESSMNFDFNWGNSIAAPSSFADTNQVCGSFKEFYAIRMRRRYMFESGYYIFSGGADDGFRVSIDGGATWILSDWSDHQFRDVNNAGSNGCGVYLSAGYRDIVVEYYENKTDSRFKFNMVKSLSEAEFTGLLPSYCITAAPVTLVPVNPQPGVFSGPGVSGIQFSPQLAGSGIHTIRYFLQSSGGGCGDTSTRTVQVFSIPNAGFENLPDTICPSSGNINLVPFTAGGVFSGQGIIPPGNVFSPEVLLPNNTYRIEYFIETAPACSSLTEQFVHLKPLQKPGNLIPLFRKPFYCNNGSEILINGYPDTKYYLDGILTDRIPPAQITTGNHNLKAIFPGNLSACIDSASENYNFEVVPVPAPSLGPDQEIERGISIRLESGYPESDWTSSNSDFEPRTESILNFSPNVNQTISVTAWDSPQRRCFGSDLLNITMRDKVEIPNLIIPESSVPENKDWVIKGAYEGMKVRLFNRWGKLVYSGIVENQIAWKRNDDFVAGQYFYELLLSDGSRRWTGWMNISAEN